MNAASKELLVYEWTDGSVSAYPCRGFGEGSAVWIGRESEYGSLPEAELILAASGYFKEKDVTSSLSDVRSLGFWQTKGQGF